MVMRQAKNTLGYRNHEQHRYQCLYNPYFSYFLAQKEVKLFRVSTSAVAYGEGPTNLLGWLSMFPWFLLSSQLRAVLPPSVNKSQAFSQLPSEGKHEGNLFLTSVVK